MARRARHRRDPRGAGRGWRDPRSADRAGGRDSRGQRACRAAANVGVNGRNAVAVTQGGGEFLLPAGASGATEGAGSDDRSHAGGDPGPSRGSGPWPSSATSRRRPSPRARGRRELRVSRSPSRRMGSRLGRFDRRSANRRRQLCRRGAAHFLTPAMTLIDVDGFFRRTSWRSPARPKRPKPSAGSTSAGRSGSTCRPWEARPRARPRRARSTRSCPSRSSGPRSMASASSRSSGRARRPSLLELAQDRAGVRGPRPAAPRRVRKTGCQAARCASRRGRRDRGEAATGSKPWRAKSAARSACAPIPPSHVGRVCRASLKPRAARSAASRRSRAGAVLQPRLQEPRPVEMARRRLSHPRAAAPIREGGQRRGRRLGTPSLRGPPVRLRLPQVAQLVEHVTENHGVGGSIPSLGTIATLATCR